MIGGQLDISCGKREKNWIFFKCTGFLSMAIISINCSCFNSEAEFVISKYLEEHLVRIGQCRVLHIT